MKFVVLNGDMQGQEFSLEGPELMMGRRLDADIPLPVDQRVSRHHARVVMLDGYWHIEDLGSANGTFLNDRRVHEVTRLRPGDRVRLGRTWLEVVPDVIPQSQREAERLVSMVEPAAAPVDDGIVIQVETQSSVPAAADAEQLRRRLLILMQVAETAGSTLELDELLRRIVDYIFEVLPAERGIILLRSDSGTATPRVVRLRGGGDETSVSVSRRIVDQAMSQHITILTEDALTDKRFRDASSIHDLRIRAALCAPLVQRGDAIGAIYLDTTSDTEVFGHDAVDLINSIAPHAAAAIANARLYTQLRAAYDELQEAQDRLVQAEKLSTIGTLAASLAHDMANLVAPLGPITERLRRKGTLTEREQDIAAAQVQRLNTMIRRLMSFARPKVRAQETIDVAELVASTVSMVQTEAMHRRVALKAEVADGLPPVLGDAGQLEQAILNLLVNALEACGEGNTVTVSAELDGAYVVITVADDGPGLDPALQERLFEPFFTTKAQGTGLGLYSVRRIIQEEHGGVVDLDTRPGEGTAVALHLPAAPWPRADADSGGVGDDTNGQGDDLPELEDLGGAGPAGDDAGS